MNDNLKTNPSIKPKGLVTVVGAGVSGRSIALLARKMGFSVFVSESRDIDESTCNVFKQSGISFESGGNTLKVLNADMMILSSGISPVSLPVKLAREKGIPVIGELDFVSPYLKGTIIGITGSNGKTTTAMLTGHLFENAGFLTGVAGNIGSPLAEHAGIQHEIIVAELSSFQIFWSESFRLELAVITNLDPDHIDWHGTLQDYYCAKRKIINMLPEKGQVICQARDIATLFPDGNHYEKAVPLYWDHIEEGGFKKSVVMFEERAVLRSEGMELKLFDYRDIPLLGKHNLENAAMSLACLALQGVNIDLTGRALGSFKAPPHRCEPVGKFNGVLYVDDSKGTNVAATVAALTSLEGRKIVILGGKGKGEEYRPLAEAVKKEAEAVVIIGEERARIKQSLLEGGFSSIFEASNMKEAVDQASALAKDGYIVLLSPACTSWDMYANYKERGEDFKRSVLGSSGKGSS